MDYNNLPEKEIIQKTAEAITGRGIETTVVNTRKEALDKLKTMIPLGASVMNGSSVTLQEIGFIDYLKSDATAWNNLHEAILKETDPEKQRELTRSSVLADYFLGSVNAIAETGELVAADASGSRVGAYPFAARNVIIVVGANKIVPTLKDALRRLREYVLPLESERAKKAYVVKGSVIAHTLIISRDTKKRIKLILINERLGF